MGKLALIFIVVVAALIWLRLKARQQAHEDGQDQSPQAPPRSLPMVACANCGVHLPATEAVFGSGGRAYCGIAHRAAAGDR